MKKIETYIVLLGLTLAGLLGASHHAGAQEYIYPLSIMDATPRATAMGGLTLGEARSGFLYSNPASFVRSGSMIYADLSGGFGTKIEQAGTPKTIVSSVGVTKWGVALMAGIRYRGGLEMPKYDPVGNEIPGRSVTLMDRTIDFAAAWNPIEELPLGIYAKYGYYLTAYGRNAVAHSFTIGSSYLHHFEGDIHSLSAALEVADFGRSFSDGKRTVLHLPANIGGAVSWLYNSPGLPLDAELGVQGRYFFEPKDSELLQLSVGGEITYDQLVSLQLGYQYAWHRLSFVGCGLGVRLPYVDLSIACHFSLADDQPLHTYTAGLTFRM